MHTETPQSQEDKLRIAKEQIAAERSFYSHLILFAFIVTGLAIINLYQGGYFWVKWVILGWGVGIASHATGTFGGRIGLAKRWEERRMKKLMK